MWCPLHLHTHTFKNQFYLHHHDVLHEHWACRWGEEAGCMFHEWQVLFVAVKALNHPGIWGMWSPSPESWKLLGSREFLPRDRNLQSVHIEQRNDWACDDVYSSLELPAMFKHFLHIMIISCIIYLTFPRGNQQTCTPRLPALGGRHDLASSSQSWREQARRQVHLGISVFWQASRWEDPVLGAGEWQCFWNPFWASQGPSARVWYFCSEKSDWLLFMDAHISSWILRPHQTSCEPSNILSPAPFHSNLQKWILEMTLKLFAQCITPTIMLLSAKQNKTKQSLTR